MAPDSVTVTGLDQITGGLDGLADDLADWSEANADAAEILASAVRRTAPVRTGLLRSSVTTSADALAADVRVTARYARPVEAMRHYLARAKAATAAERANTYSDKLADDVRRAQNK